MLRCLCKEGIFSFRRNALFKLNFIILFAIIVIESMKVRKLIDYENYLFIICILLNDIVFAL